MRKHLQIFTAWLMLTLIFYNAGFCYFVVEISVQLNRSLMEKILSEADESDLLVLKISDISSVVRKGSHEIIYKEKLYDVRKEVRKNGSSYFFCIHDAEEENIVCALNTAVNNNSDFQSEKQGSHSISIAKYFSRDFFYNDFSMEKNYTIDRSKIYLKDEPFLSFNFSSVITPPPKG